MAVKGQSQPWMGDRHISVLLILYMVSWYTVLIPGVAYDSLVGRLVGELGVWF